MKIIIPENKKAYFVADAHLGMPNYISSQIREKELVEWLTEIKSDASDLFLMGDIFDFWFEYKSVVPKGYIRLLGKLAELADEGIRLHWFTGNHDMWMFDYLASEINITFYRKPEIFEINEKRFLLGHGDGLGPGDKQYKLLKKCFASKFLQRLFAWIHPDISYIIAHAWSASSRNKNIEKDSLFHGANEALFIYSNKYLKENPDINYFVFGHRHHLINEKIGEHSQIIYLGDWLKHRNYGSFDGTSFDLTSKETLSEKNNLIL